MRSDPHVKNIRAGQRGTKISLAPNPICVTILCSIDTPSRELCHFVTKRNAFT